LKNSKIKYKNVAFLIAYNPDIFVKHNFERYNEASSRVFEILREYTDLVEPLSIDEAFMDVTEDKKKIGSLTRILDLESKYQGNLFSFRVR